MATNSIQKQPTPMGPKGDDSPCFKDGNTGVTDDFASMGKLSDDLPDMIPMDKLPEDFPTQTQPVAETDMDECHFTQDIQQVASLTAMGGNPYNEKKGINKEVPIRGELKIVLGRQPTITQANSATELAVQIVDKRISSNHCTITRQSVRLTYWICQF